MKQDDKDKPTALEVATERAYAKRDIPKFVKLIGKMMSISGNKDGGSGARLFQFALAQIQKKKDDKEALLWQGALNNDRD